MSQDNSIELNTLIRLRDQADTLEAERSYQARIDYLVSLKEVPPPPVKR